MNISGGLSRPCPGRIYSPPFHTFPLLTLICYASWQTLDKYHLRPRLIAADQWALQCQTIVERGSQSAASPRRDSWETRNRTPPARNLTASDSAPTDTFPLSSPRRQRILTERPRRICSGLWRLWAPKAPPVQLPMRLGSSPG